MKANAVKSDNDYSTETDDDADESNMVSLDIGPKVGKSVGLAPLTDYDTDTSTEHSGDDEDTSEDFNEISVEVPVMNTNIIEDLEACRVKNACRIDCRIGGDARGGSDVLSTVLADTGASRMIFLYRLIKKARISVLRD